MEVEAHERGRARRRYPRSSVRRARAPARAGGPPRVPVPDRRALAPEQVGSEIDSFLSEELPGADILGSVNPRVVDEVFGPHHPTGARVVPFQLNPWKTYVPEVYDRAIKHLQDLYRSEGYLSAMVGPAQLLRRRCSLRSPPGRCIPVGPRIRPKTTCQYDENGLPLPEPPPDPALACVPNPEKGISCEPDVVLHIPIKLGPRTRLYDIAFEGNKALYEKELEDVADLDARRSGLAGRAGEGAPARARCLRRTGLRLRRGRDGARLLARSHPRPRALHHQRARTGARQGHHHPRRAAHQREPDPRPRGARGGAALPAQRRAQDRGAAGHAGRVLERHGRLRGSVRSGEGEGRHHHRAGTPAAVPGRAPRLQHGRGHAHHVRVRPPQPGRRGDPADAARAARLPAERVHPREATCGGSTRSSTWASGSNAATPPPWSSRRSGSARCSRSASRASTCATTRATTG